MPAEGPRGAKLNSRWLTVVGIGEDGLAGLGDEAKQLIAQAEVIFGGKRHLALVAAFAKGEARAWPVPFDAEMRDVLALAGRRVCVLASGDPFFHGVGATLARKVEPREMHVIPAPSAISLAAARLGWALQDIETVSLHGRPLDLIRPLLQPSARILALTSDGEAPAAIARLLAELDFGASRLTVLEALGGPNEKLRTARADAFDLENINPLNVLAIEIDSNPQARVLPLTVGLADHLFDHDGQITKREIRSITLSTLAPRRGELLWDIGAGSGSIGIEWMLAHPSMRAIAIEADPTRAARIGRNADRLWRSRPGRGGGQRTQGACQAGHARRDLHRRWRQRRRRVGRRHQGPAHWRPPRRQCGDAGDGGPASCTAMSRLAAISSA